MTCTPTYAALPARWWLRDGADLGPLRLVYNPDDLKED